MLGDQDVWGTNRLSKAESILGTGMSQNLSTRSKTHLFDQVTDEEIAEVERKLNLRPRKCLSYRAPIEVFCDGPHWQDATPGGVTVIG